jgi:hypothetical protein
MSALEGRARDAVREMAADAEQEEMRSLRSRQGRVTQEQLLYIARFFKKYMAF